MGSDYSAILAGGQAPATVSATPEVDLEGDDPDSRVVMEEEPDEVTPSEAIVERDVLTVLTSQAVADERLEGIACCPRASELFQTRLFITRSR